MRRPECYAVRRREFAETLSIAVLLSDADPLFRRESPNWRATNSLSVPARFTQARSHPFPD
jgi:hypothetical protein